jgi:hypothetical protein
VYVSEGAMTFRKYSILNRLPFQPSATMYRAERLEGVSRCPIPSKPPNSRNHNNPKRMPGPTHTGRNTTFLEEYSNSPALLSGSVSKPEVAQLRFLAFPGGAIRPCTTIRSRSAGPSISNFCPPAGPDPPRHQRTSLSLHSSGRDWCKS